MNGRSESPADWRPDPTGRFEYRYWDGQQWTQHVARNGIAYEDPLDSPTENAAAGSHEAAAGGQRGAAVSTGRGRPYPISGPVDGDFTFVERVHSDIVGPGAFEKNQEAAQWLKSQGETGFSGRLLTDRGEQLSPDWIDVSEGWVDPRTGDCLLSGYLTHSTFGLEPAYDLGAADGRNMHSDWGPQSGSALLFPPRALFVGNAATGFFQMGPAGRSVAHLLVDPSGSKFATVESTAAGEPTTLWLGDVGGDGTRRFVSASRFLSSGNPRFSPDGEWVGMGFTFGFGFHLVNVASGRSGTLAAGAELADAGFVAGWDWWPGETPKILVVVQIKDRAAARLVLIDLLTSQVEVMGEVTVPVASPDDLPELIPTFRQPVVSPDASKLLVRTCVWSLPGRPSEYDARDTLAQIDLASFEAEPVSEAFLNDPDQRFPRNSLTRDQSDCRWFGGSGPTSGSWRIDPELASRPADPDTFTNEPPTEDEKGFLGDDYFRTAALLINHARGEPFYSGPGPGPFLPEIVRLLIAAKEYPDRFEELDDFVFAVCMKPDTMEVAGGSRVDHYDAYVLLGSAAEKVRFDRVDQIDWLELQGG